MLQYRPVATEGNQGTLGTCSSALLSCSRAEKLKTSFICGKHTGEHLVMKDFNIRLNRTEKKCGPRKTRMTCHEWDTSNRIGVTTSQQGRDGLDIHCCCALPIQGKYHEYTTC